MLIDIQKFLTLLNEEEDIELAKKTGWGRNELKLALAQAKQNALIRFLTGGAHNGS